MQFWRLSNLTEVNMTRIMQNLLYMQSNETAVHIYIYIYIYIYMYNSSVLIEKWLAN